jgi:hypothetical protein
MKAKHIIPALVICAGVMIGAILAMQYRLPVAPVITDSGTNSLPPVKSQPKVVTSTEVGKKTNAVSTEGFSLKIIDPKTGQCAIVGLDRQTITLKDKSGNVIWTVNLANEGDKVGLPVGNVDGDDVKFLEKSPVLYVSAGRASFDLDVHTGKVLGGAMH